MSFNDWMVDFCLVTALIVLIIGLFTNLNFALVWGNMIALVGGAYLLDTIK